RRADPPAFQAGGSTLTNGHSLEGPLPVVGWYAQLEQNQHKEPFRLLRGPPAIDELNRVRCPHCLEILRFQRDHGFLLSVKSNSTWLFVQLNAGKGAPCQVRCSTDATDRMAVANVPVNPTPVKSQPWKRVRRLSADGSPRA